MSLKRQIDGRCTEDSNAIDNIEYNSFAGGQKNLEVGPALKYQALLTSEQSITPGDQLFIFKTTAGIGYVTLSKTTGAVVGTAPAANTFPVFGESYTRISAADYKFIIGAADIHLYILRDDNQARIHP